MLYMMDGGYYLGDDGEGVTGCEVLRQGKGWFIMAGHLDDGTTECEGVSVVGIHDGVLMTVHYSGKDPDKIEPYLKRAQAVRKEALDREEQRENLPLRCGGCSFFDNGFCRMREDEVTEKDYCSKGAWIGKE